MSSFTNTLILEDTGDGKNWRVHRSFQYYLADTLSGWHVPVEKGFITDLASIPRAARVIVSVNGKGNNAAVVHDKLYRRPVVINHDAFPSIRRLSRQGADRIFYDALLVAGASPARAMTLYLGVRVGGWIAWRRYRNGSRLQ